MLMAYSSNYTSPILQKFSKFFLKSFPGFQVFWQWLELIILPSHTFGLWLVQQKIHDLLGLPATLDLHKNLPMPGVSHVEETRIRMAPRGEQPTPSSC
mmetsp:Transcript_18171/g.31838  ORF Transcript_18171/g.31838 Transcript_18171/m.31838 type:complete len:98 (+) Transcript_18171:148-441(+)